MKAIRLGFGTVVMALLALGYAASQRAALSGEAPDYATRVDTPPVKFAALLVVLAIVGFALVRDRDQEAGPE